MVDGHPPVTPKNEQIAPLISSDPAPEQLRGLAQALPTPEASFNPSKSHPILDALASILLVALFIALAGIVGFAAYWLMR
jgi:hypothetical protein